MAVGCSLVILAGGRSRRMGRNKATLPVGQGTLLEHIAARLAPVVEEIVIAGGESPPRLAHLRYVDDRHSGQGPLAGMHAGFLEARWPRVWVVACDLPDVEPGLGALLVAASADCEAVVPLIGGEPQGACALYDRTLASRIDALLNSGERSIKALLAGSRVRYLTEADIRPVDPDLRSFHNLNTQADYEAWLKTARVWR